jgi:ribosomal 30S subunit maturation factor RimM
MKKTIAVLGLAAISNAIQSNYVDDEYFGLGVNINSKVQTADVHGSRGVINVHMRDDADNELRNVYNMPHNQGDIQFNDYTVKGKKDDADDEFFFGVKINNKVQTADVHGSHGMINVNMRDDAEDEFWGLGVDVKSKVQTVNASGSRGKVNLNFQDDADNELNNIYNMPHNKGNIQFNDYTVQGKSKKDDADDEYWGLDVGIKSKVQTADVHGSRGTINVNMKDDTEDEFWGLGADIKSKVQTADVHGSRGKINVNMRDDAEDEFWGLGVDIKSKVQTADVHGSRGKINVNMRDDADDEFFSHTDRLNRDEIEVLRSLLKHTTQDKNGNVLLDGVKIGKIPKVKEHKTLKTNTTSKPQASIPERKFLAF